MGALDYLILALVAAALALALGVWFRGRGKHTCSGDCSSCRGCKRK